MLRFSTGEPLEDVMQHCDIRIVTLLVQNDVLANEKQSNVITTLTLVVASQRQH